jgi:hypothetical protein
MLMLAYRLSFILDIRVIGPKRAIYLYDRDLQLDLLMIFYPHLLDYILEQFEEHIGSHKISQIQTFGFFGAIFVG